MERCGDKANIPSPASEGGNYISSAVAGYIEDRDCLAEAFQGEVADLFELDIAFDRAGDPLRDQDLAVCRLVAEPGGEVAYRADRRVVDPLGKADLAEGR